VAPRRFLSYAVLAAMHDLLTEFVPKHTMADFKASVAALRKYSAGSQSVVAGTPFPSC